MDIVTDLGNITQIITAVVEQTTTIAAMFTQWPLVLIPATAIFGLVFAKAKGLMKLRK